MQIKQGWNGCLPRRKMLGHSGMYFTFYNIFLMTLGHCLEIWCGYICYKNSCIIIYCSGTEVCFSTSEEEKFDELMSWVIHFVQKVYPKPYTTIFVNYTITLHVYSSFSFNYMWSDISSLPPGTIAPCNLFCCKDPLHNL